MPSDIFDPVVAEISQIDWQTIEDPSRGNRAVFSSSTSIHVRKHKVGDRPYPQTIEEWSVLTECEDNPRVLGQYPEVYKMANWMVAQVNGIALGRIMIVNLAPNGTVPPHIAPLDYFAMYSRFHVPIKTNPGVVFSGGPSTEFEHMPQQYLSQLNNRLMHQVNNNSSMNRIHVIVDIALEGGNQIF